MKYVGQSNRLIVVKKLPARKKLTKNQKAIRHAIESLSYVQRNGDIVISVKKVRQNNK